MNNAFKPNKILVLTENYLIKPDNNNGVVLVFHEERERENKDFETEVFTFKKEWNFPRIAQALRMYADLELAFEDNIEALIEKADKVYSLIDSIDKTFKQF